MGMVQYIQPMESIDHWEFIDGEPIVANDKTKLLDGLNLSESVHFDYVVPFDPNEFKKK